MCVVRLSAPGRARPVRHAHGLAEAVQLQPAARDRVHDARVVDRPDRDAARARAQHEVAVRRGTEPVCHKKMQAEKYVLELKKVKLTHSSTLSGKERSVI